MDEYLPYAVLVLLTYCHPPPSLALRVSDPGIPKQGISGFGNQASLCIFFFFFNPNPPPFFFFSFSFTLFSFLFSCSQTKFHVVPESGEAYSIIFISFVQQPKR